MYRSRIVNELLYENARNVACHVVQYLISKLEPRSLERRACNATLLGPAPIEKGSVRLDLG